MRTDEFDYNLPLELIAQAPTPQRDEARLLVFRRKTKAMEHHIIRDLPDLLDDETLMVFNDTKVIPARLYGQKKSSGKLELLLLERSDDDPSVWHAIGKARRGFRIGDELDFDIGLRAVVLTRNNTGEMTLRFSADGNVLEKMSEAGVMPLPPYIKRTRDDPESVKSMDKTRYQTVYADKDGAIASPTAGLHFTPELLRALEEKGVERVHVTLHVGVGTFMPVRAENIDDHDMHSEEYEINPASASALNEAKRKGKRILAVGTTSCRALESSCRDGVIVPARDSTKLFIKPGYRFGAVDALMTNFHLPRSTLLMLVSALIGRETLFEIYREAIAKRYRFYSYGDAMMIL